MKAIFELSVDFGRMGEIEGLFIAEKNDVKKLIDNEIEIYFGEILGKHSDVSIECTADHFTMKSDDQSHVSLLLDLFKSDSISGYNPFDYVEPEDLE